MKRKFEELRENLDEFIAQAEYSVLVVGCLPAELAYVVKFLQALEEKHPQDFFVIFPHPFDTPDGYLNGMVENLLVQTAAAGPARAGRGEPPFPPVPVELADRKRPAEERLAGVLQHLRGLLPEGEDHDVVVGLLPLQCASPEDYARLALSVIQRKAEPWMDRLRVVLYDDRSRRLIGDTLRRVKDEEVLAFEVDFSTPALTDALSRDAADAALPIAERMACLMQLAALDYSYKRYPDALQKYGALYGYYDEQKIPSMQALCLLGAGDTLRAGGKPAAAKEMMQRGIALATEHRVLPVLLNLLLSVVDLCAELGHHADAESYADSGTKVAAGLLNPFAYADLFEKKGDAQIAQQRAADGMASYERSEELCKTYEHFYRWKSVLGKRAELYRRAEMATERREMEHRLALVEELSRRGGQEGLKREAAQRADSQRAPAAAEPAPVPPNEDGGS